MLVVPVLKDSQRFKLDSSDDAIFYSEPRFVHHLDAGFRARLTALYRERIPPCAQVLDLMSSWVSHLPEDVSYDKVIGHGLNAEELNANPRLDQHWVQNLNQDQTLPVEDGSIVPPSSSPAGSTCCSLSRSPLSCGGSPVPAGRSSWRFPIECSSPKPRRFGPMVMTAITCVTSLRC